MIAEISTITREKAIKPLAMALILLNAAIFDIKVIGNNINKAIRR